MIGFLEVSVVLMLFTLNHWYGIKMCPSHVLARFSMENGFILPSISEEMRRWLAYRFLRNFPWIFSGHMIRPRQAPSDYVYFCLSLPFSYSLIPLQKMPESVIMEQHGPNANVFIACELNYSG